MVTALPRIMIAAPGSGHGKTTVATGLMAAWRAGGREVAGFKVGPDYIDPGYHALATGRPGRNLDPVLCGVDRLAPLLGHGARTPRPCDVAVIEGVMGLFDGQLGGNGFGSTAHVAGLLSTPVVLVIDISRFSRTAAAVVHGLHTFDPARQLSGVILNRAGSDRHRAEVTSALATAGVPVLGVLPRDDGLSVPSRHLGLVPSEEQEGATLTVARLGARVAEHLDLAALWDLAQAAPPLTAPPWSPAAEVHPVTERRPVVAVAGGRAFTFRYAETEELLAAAGCRPVIFDPLTDPVLPVGTAGLYLGGGFPEIHALELNANASLRADIAAAVAAGLPTVAECAGLLYLSRSVDGIPMVGAIPAEAAMTPRLTLGYRAGRAIHDHLLAGAGTVVHGHEFHRTAVRVDGDHQAAWWLTLPQPRPEPVDGPPRPEPVEGPPRPEPVEGPPRPEPVEGLVSSPLEGFAHSSLYASYLHLHWAGHPELAQRFAAAVHAFAEAGVRRSSAGPASAVPLDHHRPDVNRVEVRQHGTDLDHHGDAEVGGGLIDFAVNVALPRPPGWLIDVINSTTDQLASYPDPAAAVEAIAARHHCRSSQVLPTAGAAEAFTLLARALRPTRSVVVHPQFTEPERALRQAGHPVERLILAAHDGFTLHPAQVPPAADLIMIGNPTNPTGTLHARDTLRRLLRPGRVVCVDEAFMDAVPEESESLLRDPGELTGVVVVRSLTKTWGLAGLRAGYAVGDARLIARMRAQQPPWSVSTPALAVTVACLGEHAAGLAEAAAVVTADRSRRLIDALAGLDLPVAGSPRTPFVLIDAHRWEAGRFSGWLRAELRERGFALRRGDTFPGLDAGWLRAAVRDHDTNAALIKTLRAVREWSG